jgi:hypothetical protein
MALGRLWAGKVFGTSTGNLFVKFEGEDAALKGTLHFSDDQTGIVVYNLSGSFDGARLLFEGTTDAKKESVEYGHLTATAHLQPTGSLNGEWKTDIGSAGTFVLFPHSRSEALISGAAMPDQMYTARHNFGPILIDRDQIIALSEDVQRDFSKNKVIMTYVVGSEQSRYLDDFKKSTSRYGQTTFLKIFAREPDGTGIDRIITVEFGPELNYAMAQSSSESWSLGEVEKLKREIRKFERVYATKKIGVGINQVMILGAIVFLPSLDNLRDRAILMAGVFTLIYGVDWLHTRYLPHAAIYLNERKDGWMARFLPSAASWLIGIAASVIATLLGAYLKGWLSLANP